eukprot:05233.XXX_57608_53198_1 [CDS] Oithona nana genome sequencing.
MNGLHHDVHHFNSYDEVQSLPGLLKAAGNFQSGIIGKKHVGPKTVYEFDEEHTEETGSIMQLGRNITKIKNLAGNFIKRAKERSKDFFLYVAFHDPHRCGHTHPEYGMFCEKFGSGQSGFGVIPDWKPVYYRPEDVLVPYFVPDTPAARQDIAAQYTTISRLDQGVGLILQELKNHGVENDTLVIFSSDNGIPFPSGRTNFYDPGIRQPLLVYNPLLSPEARDGSREAGIVINDPVSLLDVVPTVMDWHNLTLPGNYSILRKAVSLTGTSLLSTMPNKNRFVFGSHNFHEITMPYPMRYIRSQRYKLIHNLNYASAFPIDQDFYISPTFQDLLQRTFHNQSLHWYKHSLGEYYQRPEFELFDLKSDPEEKYNIAQKGSYKKAFEVLHGKLIEWQKATHDPWLCAPHAVYEDKGHFKDHPQCMPLFN